MTVTISGLVNAFGGSGFSQQEAVISLLYNSAKLLGLGFPCFLVAEHHRGLTVELTVPLKVEGRGGINLCKICTFINAA